jgi:hypothetical protein
MWVIRKPLMKCPPGGVWRYTEDGVDFEGETFAECASKVAEYRASSNKIIAGVNRDVAAQMQRFWPWLFEWAHDETDHAASRSYVKLHSWLAKLAKGAVRYANDVDVAIREEACLGCKYRVAPSFPTEEDEKAYNRMAAIVSRGKHENHPALGWCDWFHHDNRVAILLERTPEGATPNDDFCWVEAARKLRDREISEPSKNA